MPQDPKAIASRIGLRIAQLRRTAGLTQEDLAERLGISIERVSRIERKGNLTVHTIVRVANALGVDAVDLWKDPGPEPTGEARRGRPRKRSASGTDGA